jgi:hypothetical protein
MVPATGWLAVFVDTERRIYTEHVALWAWKRDVDVDDSVFDRAVGVVGRQYMDDVEHSEDSDYFLGYIHESEDPQEVYGNRVDDLLERVRTQRAANLAAWEAGRAEG